MRGVLFFSDFLLYSIKRNEFFEITDRYGRVQTYCVDVRDTEFTLAESHKDSMKQEVMNSHTVIRIMQQMFFHNIKILCFC